jgi:transposase InsO family protein
MNIHENARTIPASRALLVSRVRQEGWRVREAAWAAGISERTAYKWLRRAAQGDKSLRDRPSRARRLPHALPAQWAELVEFFRRYRQTARAIGEQLGLARSTVSAVLARRGLGPWRSLEPPRPPCRYERRRPGDLLHLDVKKLGRFWKPGHRVTGDRGAGRSMGAGWEFVHVAIDDHSRIAYAEILPDETGASCVAFLQRARAWFSKQGIAIRRLLTDNGTGYRCHRFRDACQALRLKHLRTKPRTPQTNGKAERFIQTMLREWAYGRFYRTSVIRATQLARWLRHYNQERPHASLSYLPPFSRRPSSAEQRS